jgi:competence protein ComEC
MSTGAFVGRYSSAWVTVCGACAGVATAAIACRIRPGRLRYGLLPLLFALVGLIVSSLTFQCAAGGILPRITSGYKRVTVSGRATSTLRPGAGGESFTMAVEDVRAGRNRWHTGEVLLVNVEGLCRVRDLLGRSVRVTGRIAPGGRSAGWLLELGASCSLSADARAIQAGAVNGNRIRREFERLRQWMSGAYRRIFPERIAGFIDGVTLSKTESTDPEIISDLRATGLSHVVAVAGLHVGSAAVLVLALLSILRVGRRSRYACAAAAAFTVMGLAGFRLPASRAFIMAALCFGGMITGMDYDPLAGLSIAGMALLGINPRALFDPGFQFSFAAALAIVLSMGRARARNLDRVRASLLICSAAQLGILPLVLLSGEGVSLTALAANLVVVPLVGPLLLSSWCASLLTVVFRPAAALAAVVPAALARAVTGVASALSRVPRAWPGAAPTATIALLLYALALALLVKRARRKGPLFGPMVCAFAAMALIVFPALLPPALGARDRVTALDVGEGDAILIQDRFGSSVLIDGGPDPHAIVEKLSRRGVSRIDLVISSHPHADHLNGLVQVMREIPVDRLLYPGMHGDSAAYRELLDIASEKRVPTSVASEGQVISVSRATELEVLYAGTGTPIEPDDENNQSLVAMATIDGARVLLAGDIEAAGQKVLLGFHPDLKCDVLKIPHQGADNAATNGLFDSCRPEVALISVEKGNSYGHPAPGCLRKLSDRGIRVLRTDMSGDIELSVGSGRIGLAR